MEVNERIKQRRLELGLSIREVAARMNVSPSTVLRYESTTIKNMGIDKINSIAAALNCTPEYLMGWGEKKDDASRQLAEAIKGLDERQAVLLLAFIKSMKGETDESN